MVLIILMGYIYRKRQLIYLNQQEVSSMEHDTFPDNAQDPAPENAIALDNFDLDNSEAMPTWERNAHVWIDQQMLSIKNENYKE